MDDFAVMLGSDVPGLEPRVARYGEWIGVGLVRLDAQPERSRLASDRVGGESTDICATESGVADSQAVMSGGESRGTWESGTWMTGGGSRGTGNGGAADSAAADLATVLGTLAESGASGVAKLVGDFAFVAWNRERRQLVAARDTFGVRRLYMARRGSLLTFSTRASLLARTESYDMEYFAEYLLHGDDSSGRTAFKEVEAVRSAELVTWDSGTLRRTRYWEPPEEGSTIVKSGPEIVEEFRSLLFDAVRSRLTGRSNVWSHLTGGMDSSSVVAVAQTLAARGDVDHGVAGVVTYESDPPLGGDMDHARMVAERYGLRHEVLRGWRVWEDDGEGVPAFDQPTYEQANHEIGRRLAETSLRESGTIFLTGLGGDLYLRPQFDIAADLVRRRQYHMAVRAVAGWAVATRQSFWRLFAVHGIYPILPRMLRYTLGKPETRVPSWLSSEFERTFALRDRTSAARSYSSSQGMLSRLVVVEALHSHAGRVCNERIGEANVEWRHPFLHRPLVEYGMRLPQEWLVAPGTDLSKRALRMATMGILPEPVRLRRGKGGLQPGIHDALVRRAEQFKVLTAHSRLAALGCVDGKRFAQAVCDAAALPHSEAHLLNTALTLEVWLNRRADPWP